MAEAANGRQARRTEPLVLPDRVRLAETGERVADRSRRLDDSSIARSAADPGAGAAGRGGAERGAHASCVLAATRFEALADPRARLPRVCGTSTTLPVPYSWSPAYARACLTK
eukprot:COSAG02_NODE_572_length_20163_cov_9.875461_13_plen_113_part_00